MSAATERWTEIRGIHKTWGQAYRLMGGAVLVGVGILIGMALFANNPRADGYTTNLYTEFISIGVTVFILDYLNRARDRAREERQLQARLIREAGSPDNATALNAVRELHANGWLKGKGGVLARADLRRANLERAKLWDVNLYRALLWDAYLEGADLYEANLEEASLLGANLSGANLMETSLRFADLRSANLEGADLYEANLEGVQLEGVRFDESVLLPNGENWTPETDMTRFTDPEHPDFWRSDDPGSPAYRGRDDVG